MHGLSFDSSFDVGTCILAPEIDVHPEFLQSSQSSQKIHAVAAEAAAWLGAVSSESSLTAKFPCPIPTLILLENESNWILFLVVRIIDTPEHTGRKPS